MEPIDLTIEILKDTRTEIRGTIARVDKLSARLEETNERLDRTSERLDQAVSRIDLLAEGQTRIATEVIAMSGAVDGTILRRP